MSKLYMTETIDKGSGAINTFTYDEQLRALQKAAEEKNKKQEGVIIRIWELVEEL